MFDFSLDLIQLPDIGQRLLGNLALVAHMQVKELAPRMGQTSRLGDAQSERLLITCAMWCNT